MIIGRECLLLVALLLIKSSNTFQQLLSRRTKNHHPCTTAYHQYHNHHHHSKKRTYQLYATQSHEELSRRDLLSITGSSAAAIALTVSSSTSNAAGLSFRGVKSRKAEPLPTEAVTVKIPKLSSEYCLLKLLPVKNDSFKKLRELIEMISIVRLTVNNNEEFQSQQNALLEPAISELSASSSNINDNKNNGQYWKRANQAALDAVEYLDQQRDLGRFEPAFNEEENVMRQIEKSEVSEVFLETLRKRLIVLTGTTKGKLYDATIENLRLAFIALADVGELLVKEYPFDVPSEGKFSTLPRLLGRTKVTFTMTRRNKPIGDITIIADGFAAPIIAGNFVDLSVREFYTGLPVKSIRKNFSSKSSFSSDMVTSSGILSDIKGTLSKTVVSVDRLSSPLGGVVSLPTTADLTAVPILGSYKEGFIDPLTAKPRRMPLEIARIDKDTGKAKILYSTNFASKKQLDTDDAELDEEDSVETPLLSFKIPGIVALNHPDSFNNGGSSEFFCLSAAYTARSNSSGGDNLLDEMAKSIDGKYSPFGYIIGGYEVLQSLKPGDVIGSTRVDEWGLYNLKRLRGSSFADILSSSDDE